MTTISFRVSEEQKKQLNDLVDISRITAATHLRRAVAEYIAVHLIRSEDGTYTDTGADVAWVILGDMDFHEFEAT